MITWRALLLVYRAIALHPDPPNEIRTPGYPRRSEEGGAPRSRGDPGEFRHTLSDAEVAAGVDSFARFPALAAALSGGEVGVTFEVAHVDRPLVTLTPMGDDMRWPSPDDTRPDLDRLAPAGAFDSLFVLWPQRDLATGAEVRTGGWGLAIRATGWSNGATYATVANTSEAVWSRPVVGEVWLHEWLHGVCDHFARRGFEMPPGDADGGGRAGYESTPAEGWTGYYRDLMTGRVPVENRLAGIPPEAWRTGSILG